MPVFKMPRARKYDLSFRIFVSGAVLAGAILLFSFVEPAGTSHSTNVVLAVIMGAIVLGTVVCAYVLPYTDAMLQLKRAFEWELTADKVIQRHRDGATVDIALNDLKSLSESSSWLLVSGSEPTKRIAIPSDVEGFEQLRRELITHCVAGRSRMKWPLRDWIVQIVFALTFLLTFVSHDRTVFLISSAVVLFVWPVWVGYSFKRIWRGARAPTPVLLGHVVIWLLMCVWIFGRYTSRRF